MSPEMQELIKLLGQSAVFIMMLAKIYEDGKRERAEMLALLREMVAKTERMDGRLTRLEQQFDDLDATPKVKRFWIGDDGEIKS